MKQKQRTVKPFNNPLTLAKRDERGVLCVPTSRRHRIRLSAVFRHCFGGAILAGFACLFLFEAFLQHRMRWFALCVLAEGCGLLYLGLRTLWIWGKLQPLTPTSVLCARFGVDVEQLKQIAAEHGIRPDANVAGQDYFRVSDFGDITTLLRASTQPLPAADTLLRPARGTEQDAGEQLLRA